MGCVASSRSSRSRSWWKSPSSSASVYATDQTSTVRRKRSSVPQHEFLSDREKALIERTWRRLSRDSVGAGTEVFLRIFELAPGARLVFNFRGLADSELVTDVVFRSHATRFMRAVDSVMANLDALDVIVIQNLVQLGRYHATVVRGFRCEYLDVFETAMVDVWSRRLGRRRFDATTRRAWVKIFRLITSRVHEGFNQPGLSPMCCPASPVAEANGQMARNGQATSANDGRDADLPVLHSPSSAVALPCIAAT